MSGIQSVNSVSFGSNYIIPFRQIKDSETMRALGSETARFGDPQKDLMKTDEGIVIRVPDSKDAEYEAVLSKYGLGIQKYNGPFNPTPDIGQGKNAEPAKNAGNANLPQPKLQPTDKQIIKFSTKDGNNMMAREVKLENGHTCMAVSDEKIPDQTTLMSHEEFEKYKQEIAK